MLGRRRFKGVFTANVTPFNKKGHVDLKWMTRHLAFLKRCGVDGVVVCGTNGEGQSLSLEERMLVTQHALLQGSSLEVIVSTGFNNLPDTLALSKYAEEEGAEALLVMPPNFDRRASEEGIFNFYSAVLRQVKLPVFLYNIPQMTGLTITHSLVNALCDYKNLAGVKDSTGDVESMRAYVQAFPKLDILCGSDRKMLGCLNAGASGVITGTSNVFPAQVVDVWDKFKAGEPAGEAQELLSALCNLLRGFPERAATKYALHLHGLPQTYVRPPAVELTKEQKIALTQRLQG